VSDNTGIADIVFDAFNPDVIYAASYQRRRHVGILVAGGPEGTIYRSEDAGETWSEIEDGLPPVDRGRIALEVSPFQSGVVYALVAAQDDQSGFYRSADFGTTWTRQSDYIVVDPQYYGELFADPHRPGRLCAVDVNIHCTSDEGRTFEALRAQGVHVDHHEILFDPADPKYMLIGNDGGLYESWDAGDTWRHHGNLPVTQFYRVGVDNQWPFYWVFGGTQDNGTLGGPSGSRNVVGVRNADWTRIVGGDGFQARVDSEEPHIVYGMSQGARIVRVDMVEGTSTSIAPPQVDENGDTILWHWDIPLTISRFDRNRIYALGSRLARSPDRGDTWELVSPDLSRGIDRDTLPVMGRVWPENAVWKNVFTNDYGIGVAFSESPLDEDVIVVGTDDGLIQITEDGGDTWRAMDSFPGIPTLIYVSSVVASRHDPDRIYATFNNHKRGDFQPYILRSDDRGESWTSIASDLPARHVVWDLVEDPEVPGLLFAGTEFGVFFSPDGGGQWIELGNGLPTIPVRDIEIQEREGDLVLATFGRGFFVLDDYTALRDLARSGVPSRTTLFDVRPTTVFEPIRYFMAGSGAGDFTTENPPFGAIVDYLIPASDPANGATLALVFRDASGRVLAEVEAKGSRGLHRGVWNLRERPPEPEGQEGQGRPGSGRRGPGPLVEPGRYTVTLERHGEGESRVVTGPEEFSVVGLDRSP
jgi:photosystem II stability/assembly factor-like uncharacterized protein